MKVLVTITMVGFLSQFAHSANLDNAGILREGCELILLRYPDALRACPPGTHLPTARESAINFVGPESVVEARTEEAPSGYDLIETRELVDKQDRFYFSNVGYRAPIGDSERKKFWTASNWVDDTDAYAWAFDGVSGRLSNSTYQSAKLAVRCIPN